MGNTVVGKHGVAVITAFEPDELEVNANAWIGNHPNCEIETFSVVVRKGYDRVDENVSVLQDQLVLTIHYWEL